MRIMLVSDFSYPLQGGTERHVVGIAKYLVKKGHYVEIISPAWREKHNTEYNLDGVIVRKFNLPFMKNPFIRALAYFFLSIWYAVTNRIQIIHCFYTLPAIIPSILAAKILRKKSVLTFFEFELLEWQRQNFAKWWVTRQAFDNANYITTLSYILENKIKHTLNPRNISTVMNWVDSDVLKLPSKLTLQSAKNRILFMGRLVDDKGIFVLLEALSLLKKELKFELILCGPPVEEEKVKLISKKLGIIDKISFRGFIREDELTKYYSHCDILILPSIRREGQGFVLIEAMAFGKPVIGSDDGGIPDAIGDAGIIVKKGDVKKLANAIRFLLTNKAAYKRYSSLAFERARKVFNQDKTISKYVSIYSKVMH
jgi:glycosyltransferase involved in cell wall biosynthesis